MAKSALQRRQEADERNRKHRELPLELRLAKAESMSMQKSGHSNTQEVRRLRRLLEEQKKEAA